MTLTVDQAREMWTKFVERREKFPEETEQTSFLVLLLNYGDHLTEVWCINEEWRGIKGDLQPRDGIPLCPNGHPLIESPRQRRLGLVQEQLG